MILPDASEEEVSDAGENATGLDLSSFVGLLNLSAEDDLLLSQSGEDNALVLDKALEGSRSPGPSDQPPIVVVDSTEVVDIADAFDVTESNTIGNTSVLLVDDLNPDFPRDLVRDLNTVSFAGNEIEESEVAKGDDHPTSDFFFNTSSDGPSSTPASVVENSTSLLLPIPSLVTETEDASFLPDDEVTEIVLSPPVFISSSQGNASNPEVISVSEAEVSNISHPQTISASQPETVDVAEPPELPAIVIVDQGLDSSGKSLDLSRNTSIIVVDDSVANSSQNAQMNLTTSAVGIEDDKGEENDGPEEKGTEDNSIFINPFFDLPEFNSFTLPKVLGNTGNGQEIIQGNFTGFQDDLRSESGSGIKNVSLGEGSFLSSTVGISEGTEAVFLPNGTAQNEEQQPVNVSLSEMAQIASPISPEDGLANAFLPEISAEESDEESGFATDFSNLQLFTTGISNDLSLEEEVSANDSTLAPETPGVREILIGSETTSLAPDPTLLLALSRLVAGSSEVLESTQASKGAIFGLTEALRNKSNPLRVSLLEGSQEDSGNSLDSFIPAMEVDSETLMTGTHTEVGSEPTHAPLIQPATIPFPAQINMFDILQGLQMFQQIQEMQNDIKLPEENLVPPPEVEPQRENHFDVQMTGFTVTPASAFVDSGFLQALLPQAAFDPTSPNLPQMPLSFVDVPYLVPSDSPSSQLPTSAPDVFLPLLIFPMPVMEMPQAAAQAHPPSPSPPISPPSSSLTSNPTSIDTSGQEPPQRRFAESWSTFFQTPHTTTAPACPDIPVGIA